ncbi:MAG TPA: DNA alkylation repair protein [Prolixibacteraceae bacterium]|nr:DNA alkylation repair protein [Prolixibacteraceae bacterium]HPR61917.1 DNA alkylation repair protein [Prolixibacteraceae bacterium]
MEYLIDNQEIEKIFKSIIRAIPSMQNGNTAESMEQRGIVYEKNFGCSIVDLKMFASTLEKNHLLALKLWNKKWRETKILATLLDEPYRVSEEQMDFWLKTSENIELVEQAVINLFCDTPFAFVKALEWCRGKKLLVKQAGLLMMGRLALVSKSAIDDMFEPFFEVISPLSKDSMLFDPLYRSVCQLARRSNVLHGQCVSFAQMLTTFDEANARTIGNELLTEIDNNEFKKLIREKQQ